MSRQYNRGGLEVGIAEYLGLKGQGFAREVEDAIRPVIVMRDLSHTPFVRDSIPVAVWDGTNAVAANYTYAWVNPGINVALQIRQITIQSVVGGEHELVLLPSSSIPAPVASRQFSSLRMDLTEASPGIFPLRPSILGYGQSAVATLGTTIDRFNLAANGDKVIDLPEPGIILIGANVATQGNLVGALAVQCEVLNQSFRIGFKGREFPLPG